MLKDIRQKAGKTQKEVADALNIKQTTYSAWETGRSAIPPMQQVGLSNYFDVPMKDIVTSPANVDALSDDEKRLIQKMREDYFFSKTVDRLYNMYWLASRLEGDGGGLARTAISQLIESYRDLLSEYLLYYETNASGRIALQKLENAKQLANAATEEFNEFVENNMQEFVPECPF